jgi:putative phosphotransacetylase
MITGDLRGIVERMVREAVERHNPAGSDRAVPVNISARHMHVCQDHLETLFGRGAVLTKLRDLMQPGEFAANETVAVIGPNRRAFEQVRILGPVRKVTQVELSFTDGRYLGMNLPARISGDITGTHPAILVGPKGVVQLGEGVIRALRHVHMNEDDVARLGLRSGQAISVRTDGPMGVTFDQVLVRAGKNLVREMHIDTDEANAAGLSANASGEMIW